MMINDGAKSTGNVIKAGVRLDVDLKTQNRQKTAVDYRTAYQELRIDKSQYKSYLA